MRIALLLLLSLVITSCGFHLRGTGGYTLGAESVAVVADNPQSDLAASLKETLEGNGVAVVPTTDAEYVIRLGSETTTRRPVASSGSITVSEYEVRVRALFSVVDASGKTVIPSTALSTDRIYSFDATNFVGNAEEEAVLVEEMREDLAGQLVRRLSASLRNRQTAS